MATIAFDVDGCLIEENSLLEFFSRILLLEKRKPNEKMVNLLKYFIKRNDDIIALSSRPKIFSLITKRQLITRYGPVFKKVICAGGILIAQRAERKREVIEKENVSMIFDNNPQILDYLYHYGIPGFKPEEFPIYV